MIDLEKTPIPKLLLKMSPPVMLALLIQSIYNVVDSYFVSIYSQAGLTAVSLIYPIQLLMTAVATGTGAGINILISRMDGTGEKERQFDVVRNGFLLGILNGLVFTVVGLMAMNGYYGISSNQAAVREAGIAYTRIVFMFAPGLFIEANFTKMLQAKGNMMIPMAAQVVGALVNLVLDPIFIFGMFGLPAMGTAGAAIATVIDQWLAMLVVIVGVCRMYDVRKGKLHLPLCLQIYKEGLPSIVMQSLYTLYIVGLNLILKQLTEDAVTVLGIYYKVQAFFFIPLMGLQQVILPIISFNYGAGQGKRIKDTLKYSIGISCAVMLVGMAVFMLIPDKLVGIFSKEQAVLEIGTQAFRTICCNFLPAGAAMMFVVYFQGIERRSASIFVTVLRQVILLVPLAWLLHFLGLGYVWLTFPITEVIATACCIVLYRIKPLRLPKSADCPI